MHPKNGAQVIGRSHGGLTIKPHALVKGSDVAQAGPLLAGLEVEKVVADKAYDSRALIEMTHDHGAQAVIPKVVLASSNPELFGVVRRT